MDELKNILDHLLKTNPRYKKGIAKVHAIEAWKEVVGERLANHAWPIAFFDDGVLLVGADSSAWLQSLRFLEAQILEKFEKKLGSRQVKQLRFKLQQRPVGTG